jgi:hypothetical protein
LWGNGRGWWGNGRGWGGWWGNGGGWGGWWGFGGPWWNYGGYNADWWPYWGLGYPVWSNYGYDSIYCAAPSDYYPTASDVEMVTPTVTVVQRPGTAPLRISRQVLPPPIPAPNDGTFPYDGGPVNPVPMPRAEPSLVPSPLTTVSAGNRLASLPAKPAKYTYLAYGEKQAAKAPEDSIPVFRVALQPAR